MSYPIKLRFKNKNTGEIVKKTNEMFVLNTQGQPFKISNDGYYTNSFSMSPSDYILEIALEKDSNGQWIYNQIGY